MTKEEYLKTLDTIRYIFNEGSLGHYDNVDKDGLFTEKELDQAHDLLIAMIHDAKNKLKKADKK